MLCEAVAPTIRLVAEQTGSRPEPKRIRMPRVESIYSTPVVCAMNAQILKMMQRTALRDILKSDGRIAGENLPKSKEPNVPIVKHFADVFGNALIVVLKPHTVQRCRST